MNLRIIKAGILDTVQDQGRYGSQHAGINPCGAMDRFSALIGNILVGNDRDEAVVELHFPASEFFFEQPALIAITGADFSPTLNGDEIPTMQPLLVGKFSILQFHRMQTGARAYLSIRGGLDLPRWLGSYSTHLRASIGGFKGRALQKDDEIGLFSEADLSELLDKKEFIALPWKADGNWNNSQESSSNRILVLPGPEWHQLDNNSKDKFLKQPFTISNQSDRMGYRLQGETLSIKNKEDMVSSAVDFGTIQLLPDGQLIILMADHQTAGGYPRIAHVISSEVPRLAQMLPGEIIKFGLTDLGTTENLLVLQQQYLQQLQNACTFKLSEFLV
jgi:antagonist of KipI